MLGVLLYILFYAFTCRGDGNNMKKFTMIILQVLYLILTSTLVQGCSNSLYVVEKDKEVNVIEIEFWYGLSGFPNEVMKEFIDEFNQNQNDVNVTGVDQGSYEETFKALKSSIARRNPPAVVLLKDQHVNYMASKGVLSSLENFIEEEINFETEDFIESYLEQSKHGGLIIGIPIYGSTQVLYFRKDLLEEQNLMPIDLMTWEGLAEASRKLTQKNDEEVLVYGWEPMQGMENLIDAAISNGGSFISEDGNKIMIDSPEWIEAWDYFRKLIYEEQVMKVHYGGEGWEHWYATIDDVMQGRAAGYIGSSGDQGDLDFNIIGSYILPIWDGKISNPRAVVNVQSLCIPENISEEEKKAAFKWINYITSPQVNLKWSLRTGYLPVRKSSMDMDDFYENILENPHYLVPIKQIKLGTKIFIDPTDGKIYEALDEAAKKLQIQNIPANIVLKEAKERAQKELDQLLDRGR